MDIKDELQHHLDALRNEQIEHLYCGHCGDIDDVRQINLEPEVRHLCRPCRVLVLEWI